MELSLSSATGKSFQAIFPSDSLRIDRAKVPNRGLCLQSQTKKTQQFMFGRTTLSLSVSSSRINPLVKVSCRRKKEASLVEGSSVDEIYDELAQRLLPKVQNSDPSFKYLVGLAGPPGSGKTTVAGEVVRRLNKSSSRDSQFKTSEVASCLPMDGFHLYRSQLDAMQDPKEAHARRGAPWTFNPELLLTCLQNLKSQGSVIAPSFDHGVGDPVEDDVVVSLNHKVVIVEGNYILLPDGTWKEISSMFDEKWFIEIDIDKSMQRVLRRHIATGKSPDVAKWRIECNDRPNAELIMKSSKNADLIIRSVDF